MSRRIQALRNLAERPGTPAEGDVARRMLERAEALRKPEEVFMDRFKGFIRTGSMDDLRDAVGPNRCDCGTLYPAFTKCVNAKLHESIRAEAERRFHRGATVYYNRWAYTANCRAVVFGWSRDWNWIRLKFDHLKHVRSVPFYGNLGWHVSLDLVDSETLRQTGLRGGMEKFEPRP